MRPALRAATSERAFGRVALHRPSAAALLQDGVVGTVADRECALQLRPQDFRVHLDSPFRDVAGAAEVDAPARRDHGAHSHLVPGQGAGLVGGDDRRRAKGLDRRKMAHDGVALRHSLHAQGKHGRDHRRQAFGHRGNRQRYAQDEHFEERRHTANVLDQKNCADHHCGDDDDDDAQQPADARELLLQRRGLELRLFQHAGNAPHLGVHPGRGDEGPAAPVGCRRAAEHHVAAVAEPSLHAERSDVLRYRHALAGERRLRGLQRRRLDQARVGGDGVALLDEKDVARHYIRGRDALPHAAADNASVCGRHAPQRRHRLLGARFVDVAHERVQQDDREDGDRLVGKRGLALDQPQCGGDRRRYQEQDHQRVGELSEKLLPSGHRLFGGQLVPTVALEPRPCLVFAQPKPGVGVERRESFVGAYPVGFHSSLLGRLGFVRQAGHADVATESQASGAIGIQGVRLLDSSAGGVQERSFELIHLTRHAHEHLPE